MRIKSRNFYILGVLCENLGVLCGKKGSKRKGRKEKI